MTALTHSGISKVEPFSSSFNMNKCPHFLHCLHLWLVILLLVSLLTSSAPSQNRNSIADFSAYQMADILVFANNTILLSIQQCHTNDLVRYNTSELERLERERDRERALLNSSCTNIKPNECETYKIINVTIYLFILLDTCIYNTPHHHIY